MIRYESLILTVPEITKDEASNLEAQLEKLIKDVKGTVISFERWGKYKLAYPVRKNEYGVYFLARFEVDRQFAGGLAQDIRALFRVKLPTLVMREMTSNLPMGGSLAYVKPESLEDIPTRDVDSFLRENKMEGLLSSVPSDSKSSESAEEAPAQAN